MIYAVRSVTKERMQPQYDGFTPIEVKDAKIVDQFVECNQLDPLQFTLTGVLIKIKCKGGNAFYVVADLDELFDEAVWVVKFPEMELSDDDELIAKDYIEIALKNIQSLKIIYS